MKTSDQTVSSPTADSISNSYAAQPRRLVAFMVMLCCALAVVIPRVAIGQTWLKSKAPDTNWEALACSADGKRVVATFRGGIFLSADSGADWAPASNAPALLYPAVASSADGSRLVVACNSNAPTGPAEGPILTSIDAGTNWSSATAPLAEWGATASSGDGTILVAASAYVGPNFGVIYSSTDSGITWRSNAVPRYGWDSIAASADGLKLAVAVYDRGGVYYPTNPGVLYTSSDSGNNWSSNSVPDMFWSSLAGSASGDKLVGASGNGIGSFVYTSADFGTTWTSNNAPLGTTQRAYVASSANGKILIAAVKEGGIWISEDSGSDWALTDAPKTNWQAVALSADGNKAFAAVVGGGIYVFTTPAAPQLSLKQSNGHFAISWCVPSTDFVLEEGDLTTGNWTNACVHPCLNCSNLQMELSLPAGNGSGFFRLRSGH